MDGIEKTSNTTQQKTTAKDSRATSSKAEIESMKPLSFIDKEQEPVWEVFKLWEHGSPHHRALKLINENPLQGFIRYGDRSVQNIVQRIR